MPCASSMARDASSSGFTSLNRPARRTWNGAGSAGRTSRPSVSRTRRPRTFAVMPKTAAASTAKPYEIPSPVPISSSMVTTSTASTEPFHERSGSSSASHSNPLSAKSKRCITRSWPGSGAPRWVAKSARRSSLRKAMSSRWARTMCPLLDAVARRRGTAMRRPSSPRAGRGRPPARRRARAPWFETDAYRPLRTTVQARARTSATPRSPPPPRAACTAAAGQALLR